MKIELIKKIQHCIEETSQRNCEGDDEIKEIIKRSLIDDVVCSLRYFGKEQMKYFQKEINPEEDIDVLLSRIQRIFIQ